MVRASQGRLERRDGMPQRFLDTMTAAGPSEVAELSLAARAVHEVNPRPAGSRAHVYVLQGKLITGPVKVPTDSAPATTPPSRRTCPICLRPGTPTRALVISQAP